jgi:hypothetical protein
VVGLDGGYLRNRHWAEGRRFEVIAGKVTVVVSSFAMRPRPPGNPVRPHFTPDKGYYQA